MGWGYCDCGLCFIENMKGGIDGWLWVEWDYGRWDQEGVLNGGWFGRLIGGI